MIDTKHVAANLGKEIGQMQPFWGGSCNIARFFCTILATVSY